MSSLTLQQRTLLRKQREAAQQRPEGEQDPVTSRSSSPLPPQTPVLPDRISSLNLNATPNPFTSGTSSNATNATNTTMSIGGRRLIGDRIRKRVKLEGSSEAEFTQFIETMNPEEPEAYSIAYLLRLTDLHKKSIQEVALSWTPSKNLSKSLRAIIQAALLMPNIKYYSGNLSSIIMTAADAGGIKQLPKEDDDCDALASWLNGEINNGRYLLKKTITESLSPGHELANIADLTDRLVAKLGKQFSPTLGIYFRIAFIRSEIKKNHKGDKFWGAVDDELDKMHASGSEEYIDDLYMRKTSTHTLSTDMIGEKKPNWYQLLHDNLSKIQRIKVRAKRKREEEEEEEEDQEPADKSGENSEERENQDPNGAPGDIEKN
ncbi:hypothetical protein R3P38DRAFT_2815807 [Favolaschia claudopus]|uniref:Uncharacterized protein n=1 Tax=Favolaschia claudopus TaxID=2862362 RepID=A0AAV9Z0F2_9AGAR